MSDASIRPSGLFECAVELACDALVVLRPTASAAAQHAASAPASDRHVAVPDIRTWTLQECGAPPLGTTVNVVLSEPANVEIVVARPVLGRRRRRGCVPVMLMQPRLRARAC